MDTKNISINLIFNGTNIYLNYNKSLEYDEFIDIIISNINSIENKYETDLFEKSYYITWISKIITKSNWDSLKYCICDNDTLFINNRLKGGLIPLPVGIIITIGLIFGILGPIITPILDILKAVIGFAKLLYDVIMLMFKMLEMIPLIFDPPKLIDDVIFAVSYSINTVISKMGTSGNTTKIDNSDDKENAGPFGVSKRERNPICIQPTIASLIMLILCPPLAIFYKYSFAKGFIPAIVCGVLCVKLYYFPGLLFAALMVLC